MLNKRNSIYFWLLSIMYLWFILSHMVGYSLCLTVHELSMPFREKYDRDICSRTFTLHKICVSHYHSNVHKLYCQYKQFFMFHGCNHILFLLCHILHILIRKHFVLRLVLREKYMTATCNSNIVYLNFLKTFQNRSFSILLINV